MLFLAEDFRITACVSILKWVLKMYISKKHRDKFQELMVRRENTKYEVSVIQPVFVASFRSYNTFPVQLTSVRINMERPFSGGEVW